VLGHSWLSCPPSFDTNPVRGGFFNGPCERWNRGGHSTVKAGDRLKLGWTSNNHGGGFVRIALVLEGQHNRNKNFEQNVLKVACYGHDQRPGGTLYGDCDHPCNARPGCQYQSDISDVERYDTTITVPTNLKDGVYILQFASLVGNIKDPYFSCAKLTITGGNPHMNCKSSKAPVTYKCFRSGGPPMSKLTTGIKRGEFCYHSNKMGDVDDRIREVPVNVDCDARITCDNSVKKTKCMEEPLMKSITNGWNPKQPNCGNVKPPPPPTCDDKKQNQGEEDIDCGGPCKPCPTAPPNTGRYHSDIKHTIGDDWGTGVVGKIVVSIIKDINRRKWKLTVQYDNPIKITQIWGAVITSRNAGHNIYSFGKESWASPLKNGDKIAIGFQASKERSAKVVPLTLKFEVDDGSTL